MKFFRKRLNNHLYLFAFMVGFGSTLGHSIEVLKRAVELVKPADKPIADRYHNLQKALVGFESGIGVLNYQMFQAPGIKRSLIDQDPSALAQQASKLQQQQGARTELFGEFSLKFQDKLKEISDPTQQAELQKQFDALKENVVKSQKVGEVFSGVVKVVGDIQKNADKLSTTQRQRITNSLKNLLTLDPHGRGSRLDQMPHEIEGLKGLGIPSDVAVSLHDALIQYHQADIAFQKDHTAFLRENDFTPRQKELSNSLVSNNALLKREAKDSAPTKPSSITSFEQIESRSKLPEFLEDMRQSLNALKTKNLSEKDIANKIHIFETSLHFVRKITSESPYVKEGLSREDRTAIRRILTQELIKTIEKQHPQHKDAITDLNNYLAKAEAADRTFNTFYAEMEQLQRGVEIDEGKMQKAVQDVLQSPESGGFSSVDAHALDLDRLIREPAEGRLDALSKQIEEHKTKQVELEKRAKSTEEALLTIGSQHQQKTRQEHILGLKQERLTKEMSGLTDRLTMLKANSKRLEEGSFINRLFNRNKLQENGALINAGSGKIESINKELRDVNAQLEVHKKERVALEGEQQSHHRQKLKLEYGIKANQGKQQELEQQRQEEEKKVNKVHKEKLKQLQPLLDKYNAALLEHKRVSIELQSAGEEIIHKKLIQQNLDRIQHRRENPREKIAREV